LKTVSACLIVRNEERCLDRCLSSLRGAVDELVVVDTGSADRTVEIAQAHGARVGFFAWCDDFAAARNAALDLATGDWVLSIDADEWLIDDRARAFVRLVAERAPDHFAFVPYMQSAAGRRSYVNGRLFVRRGTRWEYPIHEVVRLASPNAEMVRDDDYQLGHDGYDPRVVGTGTKSRRNRPLLERMLRESEPGSPAWLHAMVFLAQARPRPYSAEDEAFVGETILAAASVHSMNVQLLTLRLYRQWIEAGRFEEVEALNERAMAAGADGPLNHLVHAIQRIEAGDLEAARAAFARATTVRDDYYARVTLGPLFENLGRLVAASSP
jgi:glycosyltransferase involved in cell wall biosynthesis